MANPFLNTEPRDIETALLLEKAIVHDIGKAVAYTDGDRVFINTDDNLFNLLPAYDHNMLKWLLWHERYHMELRHHNRFFRYLHEIEETEAMDKFHITKEEVNIIMDILVHDSLAKMFPELVETALTNLAQMRNRNSLGYTFTTFTLEKMLDEYSKHKNPDEGKGEGEGDGGEGEDQEGDETTEAESGDKGEDKDEDKGKDKDRKPKDSKKAKSKKEHAEGGHSDTTPESTSKPEEKPEKKEMPAPEHDKTDWSKLKELDDKEFISEAEADRYVEEVAKLQKMKVRLAKITQTLNGLVTTTRKRTYAKPSTIQVGGGVILKGNLPGRASLYLVFDASGSMGSELSIFKDIISQAVPQALDTPTEWFSGYGEKIAPNKEGRGRDYYKGKFKDILPVHADSGYGDDGDRTIELCWKAEQKGYSPIGVTDGGGGVYWTEDKIKQLQRTILVGHDKEWLDEVQAINPRVQTLYVGR